MSADARVPAVGPHNHGHGIPADNAFYPALDFTAAGHDGLPVNGNGVDIRRIGRVMKLDAALLGMRLQAAQQLPHAVRPLILVDIVQRFEPFPVFVFNFLVYLARPGVFL